MDAVVAVGRLALGPLEFVRRIWHVAVRGSLIGLPGSPATQRLVGVVKRAPYLGEALVSCVFEPAARLRSPQLVFLGNQFFDPIKDGLFFHTASIVRQDRRPTHHQPGGGVGEHGANVEQGLRVARADISTTIIAASPRSAAVRRPRRMVGSQAASA